MPWWYDLVEVLDVGVGLVEGGGVVDRGPGVGVVEASVGAVVVGLSVPLVQVGVACDKLSRLSAERMHLVSSGKPRIW